VTVHSWVQGELLHRQPTAEETQRLALLMADLHEHSKQWVIPDSFRRPEYDLDNLLSSYRQLRQQLNGLIREEDFYCLEAVVGKICVDIAYQERTPDKWGIIHSDLHEGNYVFYSDSPRPIDFSNCGYGYYLFDIAETFMHLSFENQKVFISTYGSVHQLQDDYIKVIEAFFIWSIIRTFAFHSLNPNEHKALTRDLPFVIQNYCKKYLADENMLLY
jgi:Ser/Thr protein kinase RdoA (MazF antagonist)